MGHCHGNQGSGSGSFTNKAATFALNTEKSKCT